jgi:hypothetical protein
MEPKNLRLLLKLSKEDRETLENLANHWRVTMNEAIRRAVRETLKRERQ